jgi:hypothetical protein
MFRRVAVAAIVALTAASCGGPTPRPSATASPPMTLLRTIGVANETTVPVAIAVNGTVLETVPAGVTEDPIRAVLPGRPWTVEARSPSGRVLATLVVNAQDELSTTSGVAVRETLACGRLELWAGGLHGGEPQVVPVPSVPCQ